MSAIQIPVLIVGGGPAGLATALFLRRHNVDCLLAERHPGTSPLPRATGVHARSMELFREAGLEQQVRDAGLALVTTEKRGEQTSISRVILRARSLSHLDQAKVMEVGEPFSRDLSPCEPVWCGQDLLEPQLLVGARAGGADIRFSTEAENVRLTAEGVTADLCHRETGDVASVQAQYLVAADGVYSGLRESLGIKRSGAGVLDYMVSVQFRADLSAVIGDRRFILAFVANEGVNGVAVCLDGKERWMVWTAVKDEDDQASYDTERCVALARAAIGRDDVPLSITGMFPWETTHLIADRFRSQRCFLVGDAAHTHPPHGGFGANAGMQDAHNLAWKLAAVLHGQAGPGLLDTYETERRPVGWATADQALIRERHRQQAAKDPGFRDFPIVIVGYRYGSAAIQAGTAEGLSHDDALPPALDLHAAPGTRLPHVWVDVDGLRRSSIDLCAGRLTLLIPHPGSPWRAAAEQAALADRLAIAECGTDFTDVHGALAAACRLAEGEALLVRPDQFVAWRLARAAGAEAAGQLTAAVSAAMCLAPANRDALAGAAAKARQMAAAHWSASIIQSTVQLGIADAVGVEEPTSLDTIAERTGCPPDRLLRLMRALVALGFFAHLGGRRYAHTTLSLSLLADSPFSVRNLVMLGASSWNWAVWSGLADSVRDGEPAFSRRYGKSLYEYFTQDNPEAGAVFNRSMSESGQWTTPAVVDALDVTGITEVADVGGGQGGLLAAVLERHPRLRGTLVDSPPVIEQADPRLTSGVLAGRSTLVGADIRQSVPVTAQLFLLRQVMHIWDDDTCARLLSNCIDGCPAGTRVILIEHLLTDDPEAEPPNPVFSTQIDLLMMLIGSGRERTLADFRSVFERAGLRFTRVRRTRTPFALVEGVVPGP